MVFVAVSLHRGMQLDFVTSSPIQENDDSSAALSFKDLLAGAEESMIVYDDGNFMRGSIYNNPEIVELVRRKLADCPEFRLNCLFDEDRPELLFRKELAGRYQNVDIRVLGLDRDRLSVHYKITDSGTRAYLSQHAPGSRNRLFRTVDCSGVPEGNRKRAAKEMLGDFLNHFDQEFSAAKSVAV